MLDLRKPVSRLVWMTSLTLTLAVACLSLLFTVHAQDEAAQEMVADPVPAALALVDRALAATDVQTVINLLEGPDGAYYDESVSAEGDDGVGIIPHLEAATGQSAGDFAGETEVASDDPLVQALARAVAVDGVLTASLAGGDADPAALLQEQAKLFEEIQLFLSGA